MHELENTYVLYSMFIMLRSEIIKLISVEANEAEIIEDVRNKIKSNISRLQTLEIVKSVTYLEKISTNLESVIKNYSELGLNTSEVKETNEINEFQLFVSLMLNPYMSNLTPDFKIINSVIKVVNIAKEEIEAFLPPVFDSDDGIVLRKIANDTNE